MGIKETETKEVTPMDTTSRIALAHGHGLNTIAGFRVVETFPQTDRADQLVGIFTPDTSYAASNEAADAVRRDPARGYAVVDTLYQCGCWSVERALQTQLADLDEYGPNRPDGCHYGACAETATVEAFGVPYCERHAAARNALADRLLNR